MFNFNFLERILGIASPPHFMYYFHRKVLLLLYNLKMLCYITLKLTLCLGWCRARDLLGSQISVTTGGFELKISCIRSSYLTHYAIKSNSLGGFGVPEFATLQQ